MTDQGKIERPTAEAGTGKGFLDRFFSGREEEDAEKAAAKVAERVAGPAPEGLHDAVIEALQSIYDPEIPVNIYELGLIYEVDLDGAGNAWVTMTLTTPHCPVAEEMPDEVAAKVRSVEGVGKVDVDLVWDPPWDMSMMSEAARLELGFL